MNLEDRVTCGGVIYIDNIDYDSIDQRLTVRFLKDPHEQSVLARILTFTKVQNFSVEVIDDEDYLDSLLGLSEMGKEYILRTEQRELAFSTEDVPQIQDLIKKKKEKRLAYQPSPLFSRQPLPVGA